MILIHLHKNDYKGTLLSSSYKEQKSIQDDVFERKGEEYRNDDEHDVCKQTADIIYLYKKTEL